MSDIQVIAGAIITAGGTIAASLAAAIRWGVVRLATAQDRGTDALVKNAESHAELVARFDVLAQRLAQRIDQLAQRIDQLAQRIEQLAAQLDRVAVAIGHDVRAPAAPRASAPRRTSPLGLPALARGELELERMRRNEDDTE